MSTFGTSDTQTHSEKATALTEGGEIDQQQIQTVMSQGHKTMSNWNDSLWKEDVAFDIFVSPTYNVVLRSLPCSLTTIHNWLHLALATHIKNPQVALMTLKLWAHTCLNNFVRILKHRVESLHLTSSFCLFAFDTALKNFTNWFKNQAKQAWQVKSNKSKIFKQWKGSLPFETSPINRLRQRYVITVFKND